MYFSYSTFPIYAYRALINLFSPKLHLGMLGTENATIGPPVMLWSWVATQLMYVINLFKFM